MRPRPLTVLLRIVAEAAEEAEREMYVDDGSTVQQVTYLDAATFRATLMNLAREAESN